MRPGPQNENPDARISRRSKFSPGTGCPLARELTEGVDGPVANGPGPPPHGGWPRPWRHSSAPQRQVEVLSRRHRSGWALAGPGLVSRCRRVLPGMSVRWPGTFPAPRPDNPIGWLGAGTERRRTCGTAHMSAQGAGAAESRGRCRPGFNRGPGFGLSPRRRPALGACLSRFPGVSTHDANHTFHSKGQIILASVRSVFDS